MDKNMIYDINSIYWNEKGNDILEAIVLPLYGKFISEEKYRLFGDVSGKKMLEIGCGNGGSLIYNGERSAGELWGIDISKHQLEKAEVNLKRNGMSAKLKCTAMEENCGIPENYFDIVYSIYALGWTTDLEGTLNRIASYLKEGGIFIFSWSHPIHKCITKENHKYNFSKCYFDESLYTVPINFSQGELKLSDRKLSTYINAIAKAGFIIERMIEETDNDLLESCGYSSDFVNRAKMFPVTFVIKARKAKY